MQWNKENRSCPYKDENWKQWTVMIICSRTGSRPTEQKSNLENSWPHLRFWVNVQASVPKRNLEVSYLGWLDIQPVNAVELQIVVNFIELFSFVLLLVDFFTVLTDERTVHTSSCSLCRTLCVTWTWRSACFETDLWRVLLYLSVFPLVSPGPTAVWKKWVLTPVFVWLRL